MAPVLGASWPSEAMGQETGELQQLIGAGVLTLKL